MAINSYFYDSVNGDKPYSAGDFSRAFGIALETGVLIEETKGGALGFELGGTNFNTLYEGRAIIEGHFIEVVGSETLTVPEGSYTGQVVIRLDTDEARTASIVVKTDTVPVTNPSIYELVLYEVTVANGVITAKTDKRYRGGAVPNNHNHTVSEIEGLQSHFDTSVTWLADPNGVRATMGKFAGTGKPVVLFLTTARPSAVASEHRVWIQIDNF